MKKAKVSKYGQWKYPGEDTIIPNANGSITMKGVPYPVLGIDDQGNQQMMMPGAQYQFPGNSVYEIPMVKNGGAKKVKIKSLPKAQSGPNTTDPEKPYGSTIGIPSKPYQVINGQYVFTLPDNTTWSTSNRRHADSLNAYFAHGWGFTGERTTDGGPVWARIPKETTDPKKLNVEDAGTPNVVVQQPPVNTQFGPRENYSLHQTNNGGGAAYLHRTVWDENGNVDSTKSGNMGIVLTEDYLTPEQQKEFDSPTGGNARVDFNPNARMWNDIRIPLDIIEEQRGTRQKQLNMQQKAVNEIEAEKAAQQLYEQQLRDKEKARIKKAQEEIEAQKKAGGFKYGGVPHKMQTEGQFSNPDFKPSWDWTQTAAENAELNRRAQAAGHNSVDEYRASGWAWQPKPAQDEKGQGKYFKRAEPQTKSWGEKMMEIPKTSQSETSAFPNMNLKKMNQDLISGFAVAESTMPANMFKAPLEWKGKTGPQILAEVKAEEARIKAEKEREAYEKLNRHDTLTAKRTTPAQETVNQIYYALSNPIEAAGHAMKYGYIPQGNLGNYGLREDGDAFSNVTQYANPFAWGNAAYRFSNAALQPESWTTKEGLINMVMDAMEATPIVKPLGMAINSARMTAGPLVKSAGKVYNKVATGNSRLTDLGFPAWKVERPNFPVNAEDYIARTYTDAEAGLVDTFGKGMKLTPEEWAQMEDLTRSGVTDFSKADYPISRILGYYNRGTAENKLLEGLKVGDVFHTPTEETIRTWSVGVPGEGNLTDFGNTRLVVPSRYTKDFGSNFSAMPYNDKRIPFIWNPEKGFNHVAAAEKEIMGNIPKGFKVIGTSKENGLNNLIIKPLKKQGGQLPEAQTGKNILYVYSKDDPAYKKYLKQKAYYDKQKAIYEMAGPGKSTMPYDDFAELTYRNAKDYKEKFDPEIGIRYVHVQQPDHRAYVFRKPTPVILEKESNPKAIDIKPLPTQPIDIKPTLTKSPLPQTNKQRVVINTPQGDKIRVQDPKTKKFMWWEDQEGLPSDIENPTGIPQYDFKYAEGGELPKAQSTGELSREEKIHKEVQRLAYNAAAQTSANWDPQGLNGAPEEMVVKDKETGKYYKSYYDAASGQWGRQEVIFEYKPKHDGLPAKNAPKKTKEQVEKEKAIKYSQKAKNDPTLWLAEHPEFMLDADGNPVLKSSMEANAPTDYLTLQQKTLKEKFIRERNAEPLQQSLGTLDNNPQTAAAATRYANTELARPILEKNPRDKYATRAEWIESFTPQEKAIIEASNKAYHFDPNAWTTFSRALQTEGNKNTQWQRNLDLTEEEKNRPITAMDRLGVLSPLMLPAQGVQRVLTEPFSTKNFLTGVVLNNWYNGDTPKPYYGDDGTMRDYYQPDAQAMGNLLYQGIFDPLNYISFGAGGIGTELAGDLSKLDNPLANLYKYNPLATKFDDVAGMMVGEGKGAFIADPARNYTAYKAKPNFLMGYRQIKDASKLNWTPLIDKVKANAQAKILENFVTLTGGKADDIDLAQFIDYWKAYNNRLGAQYRLADELTDIGRAKIKGSPFDSQKNFSDAWGTARDEARELRTLLEEQNIQPNSPLGRSLGNGAEGMVFELAADPKHVIKVGQTFKTDNVDDLLKSFEGILGDNIAVVKRAHKDGSGLIEIMPNLDRTGKFKNLTKSEVLDKLEADARDLMSRGFFLDVDNLRGNFKYNPHKNVVDIYDVSKPAHGISYQNPDLVVEKLREHFSAFDRIPEKHPLYNRPNSAVSKPVVELTGAEAIKRLDAARKEWASLLGRGAENLTPNELLDLYNLEYEINRLSNSVKKLGGTIKQVKIKSLPKAQTLGDWHFYDHPAPPTSQKNLVGDVRKVKVQPAVAESTMPANMPKAPEHWKGKTMEQIKAEDKAVREEAERQRELAERDVLTADTRSDAEKFARQAWTAISYPMETISAVNRGHNIPMGSLGMHNPYGGYDVGGPMNFLVDAIAGTPAFIVNAASRQGEQLADDPLKYGYTMSLLGMLDPETQGQALSNTLDLSVVIPAARMAAGPLVKNTPVMLDEIMSTAAPKGNMYGQNQVLTQRSRMLDPAVKRKFFANQAPEPEVPASMFTKSPKDLGNRITPENYEDFVNRIHGSTGYELAVAPKTGNNLGIGSYGKQGIVYRDAPLNNLGKDIINAHEKSHGIFAGTMSPEMERALLKPFGTNKPIPHYSAKHQADEVLSRMAQFKNAVGIGDNQTFTLGHLNLIRKNYADQFIDNGITEMLAKIKPGSVGEREFLINMNKFAFGLTGVGLTGFGIYNAQPLEQPIEQNKQGGSKKKQPGFQVLTDANGKYVFVKT